MQLPRVVLYPCNQNAEEFNGASFGNVGCFFHSCVAGMDFLAGGEWQVEPEWCRSVLQRGTAAADVWNNEVEPLIAAEVGAQLGGFVCVAQVKHWAGKASLELWPAMRPIVGLLNTASQTESTPVMQLKDLAAHQHDPQVRSVHLYSFQITDAEPVQWQSICTWHWRAEKYQREDAAGEATGGGMQTWRSSVSTRPSAASQEAAAVSTPVEKEAADANMEDAQSVSDTESEARGSAAQTWLSSVRARSSAAGHGGAVATPVKKEALDASVEDVEHKGLLEKQHWRDFLASLAGAQVAPCDACTRLGQSFGLDRPGCVAGQSDGKSAEVVLVSCSDSDEIEGPPAKRPRGRPRQSERRPNLQEWIQANRAGRYNILSVEGKVPVQCQDCGIVFNAQKASTEWFVLRHEQENSVHLKWLKGNQLAPSDTSREVCTCSGIRVRDSPNQLQNLRHSAAKHIANGQLCRIGDPLDKVWLYLDKDGEPVMQAKLCKEQACPTLPGKKWCGSCQSHSAKLDTARSLALWSCRIDLIALLHLRLQGKDADALLFLDEMQTSDWRGVLQKDLGDLRDIGFKELLMRCRHMLLSIPVSKRTQNLQTWIDSRLSWVSPGHNAAVLVRDPEMRKMVSDYAEVLLSGQSAGTPKPGSANLAGPAALQLAKKVAAGALHGQGVLEYLLSAAVEKADKVQRGLARINVSSVKSAHASPELLTQIAWTLGQSTGKASIGQLFGLNLTGAACKVDLRSGMVPRSYCAKDSQLVENLKLAIGYVDSTNRQSYMLAFDETVYAPTWEACYGLADTPVPVGGADPDYSWVRLTDDVCQSGQPQPGKSKLPDHGLAQVTFSCGVKNLTSRGPCWDVQMIPRRHRQSNATSHFDHMGQLLEAAVLANGGKGPVVLAYDAHMNHSFVTTFAMGLSSDSSVSSSASSFWRRCRFESMSYLPAWPYRQLRYNHEDFMFVTLDAGHVQKAIARAGRSSIRKVEI
ncbi:unnamed protein product, partial [Effrenium voratum]